MIELKNVSKWYGKVQVLNNCSTKINKGEVVVVCGPSGSGKSTLIKVITGAHSPDGGTLEIGGSIVSNLTPTRAQALGVSCIYQQPALFPDLSVAENIGLRLESGGAFQKVNWQHRRQNADSLLSRIGASIDPNALVGSLSMPEQQLVEIACALGSGARTVIMDEPTASLTRNEQELLFKLVRDLRSSGVGVIYISHRLEEIFALADRVTVLRDGQSITTRTVRSEENQVSLSEDELIRLMVGRDIATIYPPRGSSFGETVLELRGVNCSTSRIQDIHLKVRAGEVLGLAGLVGAGRTELARILFGITPADSGEILLSGKEVSIANPQEAVALGIAYVPEDRRRHGVILQMPIAENISMAVHRSLFPHRWLRFQKEKELGQQYIRDLGIKAYGTDAPGGSLSGGNQQKVSLARWLATQPRLLILDEPTQGVDVGAKSEIHRIIRDLAAKGLAVLMISSDLPEILGMSDRIAVMRDGRVLETMNGSEATAQTIMSAALRST